MTRKQSQDKSADSLMCFVIMPISDPEDYEEGHFKHVYEDLIIPACKKANFEPTRADEVKESNLIQLDILNKLLEAPMAVCDLSSHNPNVLFELAIRQAFDKPVALIQEKGTPRIFDIESLRATDYCKDLKYHNVLIDQTEITKTIKATFESHGESDSINSIVKLLALTQPAKIPEIGSSEAQEDLLKIILVGLNQLRNEVRDSRRVEYENSPVHSINNPAWFILLKMSPEYVISSTEKTIKRRFNRIKSEIPESTIGSFMKRELIDLEGNLTSAGVALLKKYAIESRHLH